MNLDLMEALRRLKASGGVSGSPMMPNVPRDPERDKGSVEGFLQGKTGADFGQDPFAEPIPDAMQMAKVNGALRLPPVMKAEPMSPKDFPEGMDFPEGSEMNDDYATTMGRFKNPPAPTEEDEVVRVTPSSYFGQGKSEPKQPGQVQPNFDDYGDAGAEGDLFDDPFSGVGTMPEQVSGGSDFTQVAPGMGMGLPELERQEVAPMAAVGRPPEDPRMMLQEYMKRLQNGNPQEASKDQSLATMLQGNEQANSKLGLMQLLLASANKMGSVGGKIASNDDAAAYFGGMQKQNDRSGQMIASQRQGEKKTADDKLKAMMFMAKQKQDEEKYQGDLDFRGKQLEALTGYQDRKLGVDERRNELDSSYKNDMLKATEGNNSSKALVDAANAALLNAKTNKITNPASAVESPLDKARRLKLEAEAAQIKAGKGKGVKNVAGDAVDRKMADVYKEYVLDGGRSTVQDSISRLSKVAKDLEGDPNATGAAISYAPDAARTFFGNKGPAYQNEVRAAIQSSFKQNLGGVFTEREGEQMMATAFDPKQTVEQNIQNLRAAIKKMEEKAKMQDSAVQYYESNNGMGGYKGGTQAIQNSQQGGAPQPKPGFKFQKNKKTGEVREVPI